LIHRERTGEGQWVDLACTEAALTLHGPALLDWTVNGRSLRREGRPNSNRNEWPAMAPHGIYPCAGDDEWVAIACRDDAEWRKLAAAIDRAWCGDKAFADVDARLAAEDRLDGLVGEWTGERGKFDIERALRDAGVPVAAVLRPQERIDLDGSTEAFGLWPAVKHTKMGNVRVDGQPVHFSATDWQIERGAPCLSEHTEEVLTTLLGLSSEDVGALRKEGVV
jgi:benzylsuccinate CoA-transferase BbsF subunit